MTHDKKDMGLVPLSAPFMLTRPVDAMTSTEQTQSYAVLKFLEKQIEKRLEQLREVLLSLAKDRGAPNPNGSKKVYVEGTAVAAVRSVKKEPDFQKVSTLLASKGLDTSRLFDKVETWAFNPSKEQQLIERGYVSQAEMDSTRTETFSLRVEAGGELGQVIELAGKAFVPPSLKG